jgi:hypothetical protein
MKSKKIMVVSVVLTVLFTVICTGILSAQTQGEEIFGKVITAMGGAEKIKNVKNILQKLEITRKNKRGNFAFNAVVVVQYPDKMLYTVRSSKGHVLMAVDGTKAWQQLPPKSLEPMSDEDRKYEMTLIWRDPFYIYQNLDQYKIEYKGNRDYAGKSAIDISITGPADFHMYIDPQTDLPLGVSYMGPVPGVNEPVEQKEVYTGWKEADGLKIPLNATLEASDDFMTGYTVDVQFNIPVEKDLFKGTNIPQEYIDFINMKNQPPKENVNEKK